MDKNALRTALLALEGHELQAARDAYAGYLAASRPDDSEASGVQAHSLAVEDAELAEGLEAPLQSAEAAMARLQAIDFGPKDEVAPGALLSIGGQRFVVAVATRPFDVHGATVMGVSTDSPLYQAARGLGAGDAFELGGKARTIDSVE